MECLNCGLQTEDRTGFCTKSCKIKWTEKVDSSLPGVSRNFKRDLSENEIQLQKKFLKRKVS